MPSPSKDGRAETRHHLRGSSLLLLGRLIALGINLAVQVLIVRHLSKSAYGAFSYAIAVTSMGAMLCQLGLNKSINRLVPIFHEKRDYPGVFGALFLALGTILSLGCAMIGLAFLSRNSLTAHVASDPLSVTILLILIALCPLQALDDLFQSILAIFSNPRLIFIRRHVMGPLLKLLAVLAVLLFNGNAVFLATSYLVAGIIGTAIYIPIIYRVIGSEGLLDHLNFRSVRLPVRELFGFGLPMLTADLFFIVHSTAGTLILESMRGTAEVAEFRAVVPVAGLSLVVLQTLRLLFVPIASRLFARGDRAGLNDIYWKSTLWITVITFPVFAVCLLLAQPVTVLLFGPPYTQAGTLLAILACGNFFNVALGPNSDTLQVYGRVRFSMCVNFIAVACTLALNVILIVPFGALGAALAGTGSLVLYNLLNQAGLFWKTGINPFHGRYLKMYLLIVAALSALLVGKGLLNPDPWVMVLSITAASLLLVWLSRRTLDVAQTFPELSRIPILGRLLDTEPRPDVGLTRMDDESVP